MARVDVVIPCYNYGHFLEACVQSVLEQEGVDVSVLVVDDGSTDRSVAVARALAVKDSRVRLITLQRNVGMVAAVNRGIGQITGEYFVKLDADDLLPPGSLKRSIELLDRYPNVGFVYGRPRHFTGAVPPRPRGGRPRWTIWSGPEWFALRCRLGVNCISQPEAVIRTSTLRTVGEYNSALPHTSDLEMWLRLAAVSDVGRINGVDQGYYRVHPDSMQRTFNSGALADLLGRREAFLSALFVGGTRLSGVVQLEATVRRSIAAQALDYACWTHDRDRVEATLDDQLIDFAVSTYSAADTLRAWHGLQRRRQRGRQSRWAPGSLMARLLHRIYGTFAYYRWVRTGV
jgi:glycosyltransferase involved in cell wall biosynthesis